MSPLTAGLLLMFLFHGVLLLLLVGVALLFPRSTLGQPGKAIVDWLPPFLGGRTLRDWAAANAERMTQKRLAGTRTGATASRLAVEAENAAMHAMLPLADDADLERIIACPETGQGRVGVTAPEALDMAAFIRKHKSHAEQKRIYEQAVENTRKIAARQPDDTAPFPCALQGDAHVCCIFGRRPLRCRPLHAIVLAKDLGRGGAARSGTGAESPPEGGHERIVAEGIELGVTRALKSAGLDAGIYELNSALATALATSDAAERWAKGEKIFQNPIG